MFNRPGKRTPLGNAKNQSVSSVTTLAALAAATTPSSASAVYAQIQAVGGSMYIVTDGTTPSSTNYGRKLADGETYDATEASANWSNFKMIGTSVSIMFSG